MLTRFSLILAMFGLLLAPPVQAQLRIGDSQIGVPSAQDLPGRLPGRLPERLPSQLPDPALDPLIADIEGLDPDLAAEVLELAQDRLRRIDRLVRRHRDTIARDANGDPARRGELLVTGAATLPEAPGFNVLGQENIAGLDLSVTRFAVPDGMSLAEAQEALQALLPDAEVSADNLYFQSGVAGSGAMEPQDNRAPFGRTSSNIPVGIIDGAPASVIPVAGIRGFASGAGQASDHGSAVASLLNYAGARRIYAADVYGSDPAGGNALAIARALGWLAEEGVRVVTISLVGPDNAVLARAIRAAQARGLVVVAAVGNDGPAAPPAYPASYANVVAVTGVDRRERALIEAGRASHLDYAAPGADVYGLDRRGRTQRLRGTSYAAPHVAARIAIAMLRTSNWRARLDSEAQDLGPRGADATYGRGLVCRGCGARR